MGSEPRFWTPRNPDRRTLGPEVCEVMAALGTPAMPWQSRVLDVAYELDEEATEVASSKAGLFQPRLWYRENRVGVPRQAGKTQKALARHVHRQQKSKLYGWHPRPLSLYLAQTASDARDKMVEEWFPILEASPFDTGAPDAEDLIRVRQYLRANGREAIKWYGNGRITTKPPSRKGGHGVSAVQLVDLDEAFAHRDGAAEQGVRPGMVTSVSPQIYIVSTAGTEESEFLWEKVDDGRTRCQTGHFGRVSYHEWSAANAAELEDPEKRRACHPAVGFTIAGEVLDDEYDSLGPDEYARAYGNVWTKTVKRLISAQAWQGCYLPGAEMVGRLWLAVDATPGFSSERSAAIAIGGRTAESVDPVSGEVIPARILSDVVISAPGLAWLPDCIAGLIAKWPKIEMLYADPTGPVSAVLPDIDIKLTRNIELVDARTMSAACERYLEDVLTRQAAHLGQDILDQAVEGAAKRTLLDSWAWARRRSTSNISPLVAVTLAHWATVTHPEAIGRIL